MSSALAHVRKSAFCFRPVYTSIHRSYSSQGAVSAREEIQGRSTPVQGQPSSEVKTKTGSNNGMKPRIPELGLASRSPEQFIPITRRSLVRRLLEDQSVLPKRLPDNFEQLANALSFSVGQQMHCDLEEMKHLYDPLDPDKDTLPSRTASFKAEILEQEFYLLRHLGRILKKANFQRLAQSEVHKALKEHLIGEGVCVSVNPNNYDTLQVWVRGRIPPQRETPAPSDYLAVRLARSLVASAKFRWQSRKSREVYRRVVLLTRMQKTSKLLVKIFKDVPCERLETLLPNASISMSVWDRYLLIGSVSAGLFTVAARSLSYLADVQLRWLWAVLAIGCVGGLRSFTAYKNKRNAYLVKLTGMLYYKNVANNRGALTLLADRAADEQFKESLLAYSFLLSANEREIASGLTRDELRTAVEKWLFDQLKSSIQFDISNAVSSLMQLGLLEEGLDNRLVVMPPTEALRCLHAHTVAQYASERMMKISEGESEDCFDMASDIQR